MMSIPRRQSRRTAIHKACDALPGQPARLVRFLHEHPNSLTGTVAASIACINVSAAASRANEVLTIYGYRIVCQLPTPTIPNRFGEPSQQHQWRLVRV